MLSELSEKAIDSRYSNILTMKAGRVQVNHLVYISPSLIPNIEIMTELNTPFSKERGNWKNWSLEHLVKVLKFNAQSGGKSEKHVAQIDGLKALNWVQNAESLTLNPVLLELSALRKSFGIVDFDLNEGMLRSLTSEIRRQLMSDRVTESHQKYNRSLAEHIKTMEKEEGGAFSSLKRLIVVIGNFNGDTSRKLTELQERPGKLKPVTGGKTWGNKGGGNQEKSPNYQKGGGQGRTILRIRIQKSLVSNRMITNLLARVVVGTTKESII